MQRGIKNQPGEIRLLLVAQKHLRHKEEALALMFLSLFLKRKTNTKVYLTPFIVKVELAEVPPPGVGFVTLTVDVPAATRFAVGIVAVSDDAEL